MGSQRREWSRPCHRMTNLETTTIVDICIKEFLLYVKVVNTLLSNCQMPCGSHSNLDQKYISKNHLTVNFRSRNVENHLILLTIQKTNNIITFSFASSTSRTCGSPATGFSSSNVPSVLSIQTINSASACWNWPRRNRAFSSCLCRSTIPRKSSSQRRFTTESGSLIAAAWSADVRSVSSCACLQDIKISPRNSIKKWQKMKRKHKVRSVMKIMNTAEIRIPKSIALVTENKKIKKVGISKSCTMTSYDLLHFSI